MTIYHTSVDRTPYTYLIGWSKLDKYYYGVRYAKGCHPSDLWVKYFTSSKHVKSFRKKHDEPDVIRVRKTFSCSKTAVFYEQKVLSRLDVESSKKWLNAKNSTTKTIILGPNSGSFKRGNSPYNKGKKSTLSSDERKKKYGRVFSDDDRSHMSKVQKERFANNTNQIDHLRHLNKIQFSDPIKRERHRQSCLDINVAKDTKWINDGEKSYRVSIDKYEEYIYHGYRKGRISSKSWYKNRKSTEHCPKSGQFIIKKGE
jgi:hypothetical protein